ncbi:MAG: uL15 family ribosomal protein [Clostridia bacterium]|nr:uL15 family ribosomal protein [Clostridia bacterium]
MSVLKLLGAVALTRQNIVAICVGALLAVIIAVYVICSVNEKKRKNSANDKSDNAVAQEQSQTTDVVPEQRQEQVKVVDEQPAQPIAETLQEDVTDTPTEPAEELADEQAEQVDETPAEALTETVDDVTDETDDEDEEISDEELADLAVADDDSAEDVDEEVTIQLADDDNGANDIVYRRIRYNRSFWARLTQADDEVKARYSTLKNELLSYNKIKSALSWRRESFRLGRGTFACFVMRGKKLCLCFATDPQRFDDTKYKVVDLSIRSAKNKQPCMYRITSDRRVKFTKEIIAMLLGELEIEQLDEFTAQDYTMPYRTTEELIDDNLIKVIIIEGVEKADVQDVAVTEQADDVAEADEYEQLPQRDFEILQKVEATEVDVMSDVEATQLIEHRVVKRKKSSKVTKGIINIDVLSKKFEAGSHITLKVLRERHIIPNNVNYIKVLANGILDKPLIVEADDFSLQAVKMIALTGGRVISTDDK